MMDKTQNDTAWLRVVNFPTRGIGARSLEQLGDLAREHGISLFRAVPYMTGRAATNLGRFVELVQSMAHQAQSLTLPELIQHVIEQSGLVAHYQAEREGQDRLENLHELVSAAAAFVIEENWDDWPAGRVDDTVLAANAMLGQDASASSVLPPNGIVDDVVMPMSPLAAFLSHASLEAGDNQAQAGEDAVQLMTVHAAKGLEFDSVFISGLEDGLFPHENSLNERDGLEEIGRAHV